MKLKAIVISVVVCMLMPMTGLAAGIKVFTGVVTNISGSQVFVRTANAVTYAVDGSHAQLVRKNGAVMSFSEIIKGDKLEVKGTLWADGSVSAAYVRNMSLYVHASTFTGKVTSMNPAEGTFSMDSKKYGTQTVRTDAFTSFKKNSSAGTLSGLELGVNATVKGTWDRNYANVRAVSVVQTVRLVSIEVTGQLVMKSNGGLTVISHNVIYGIDISKAKLLSKNSKSITVSDLTVGGQVKVVGKHVSERTDIIAISVKDLTVVK